MTSNPSRETYEENKQIIFNFMSSIIPFQPYVVPLPFLDVMHILITWYNIRQTDGWVCVHIHIVPQFLLDGYCQDFSNLRNLLAVFSIPMPKRQVHQQNLHINILFIQKTIQT